MSRSGAFTAETPLMEVLQDPEGAALMRRVAPSVVDSPLLHTYHGQPVGLVVATDDGLAPGIAEELLAGLATITPRPIPRAAPVEPVYAPDYESADVVRGSAAWALSDAATVWERVELRIDGPRHGNPFVEVELRARIAGPDSEARDVLGFYDGDGRYRIRFLPSAPGRWTFETLSNARSLDGLTGAFDVIEGAAPGPVRVDGFHFRYANGDRYLPIGTTCYVWTHQEISLQEQTLRTLSDSAFTKIRMCVFPKSYTFNSNEPERYPFVRTADGWDPTRFDADYWAALEERLEQLAGLGVEADLILFHAYDRWGFATMDAATDDRYVRYAVARLASFRNLWWSLANEWDLLFSKTEADWERWAAIIQRWDATDHLRSIHNCREIYDQSRPWITHISMQRVDVYRTAEETTVWRQAWGKPVVVDECAYEGDIDQGWGNISGEEMTRRFWEGAVRGGYVGHGETYMDPREVLWWAKGGTLHGTSPERIGFLARIQSEAPGGILEPLALEWDIPSAGIPGEFYLYYFGFERPTFRRFLHDPSIEWEVDVIDTWNMTVETLPGRRSGRFTVELPARQYLAVRLRRWTGDAARP